MSLLDTIKDDIDSFKSFKLYNPLYGKNIFFYKTCVNPEDARNQLMGYLGAFSNFKKLNREIDYCIIPYNTSKKITSGEKDQITKELISKIQSKNRKTGNTKNTIPDTKIIPEEILFTHIHKELLGNDSVKIQQFERIHFPFNLAEHENIIRYSGNYNI